MPENIKPELICQECGWEGSLEECVIVEGEYDDLSLVQTAGMTLFLK